MATGCWSSHNRDREDTEVPKDIYNDSVLIEIADYVKVSDGSSNASLPLVVSHPNAAMIARLQGYQIR